ncbi:hypothetical protein CEXT_130761 [Caerostris extrusa]|uniref:Uncharacterized protein n=1 Tax=Caerostris extrusa TaxID=172846 RepID=A0AAV4VFS4_CAEEX|nr:hypothetical protein CEXT_130761 [Caerostris extrusa]
MCCAACRERPVPSVTSGHSTRRRCRLIPGGEKSRLMYHGSCDVSITLSTRPTPIVGIITLNKCNKASTLHGKGCLSFSKAH